jgi:hypothetical protein
LPRGISIQIDCGVTHKMAVGFGLAPVEENASLFDVLESIFQ